MIELIIFGLTPEVKLSPLLQKIQEPEIVLVETPPPEPTLEEKIASDYYKCEPTRYIRADTAECGGVRPEYRVPESRSTTERSDTPVAPKNTARAPAGWFEKGQCTWWVWTKRPVGNWNDATDWLWQAQRDGYTTSKTPIAGAIAWEYGHVAFVESVNGDGTVTISEANYDYRGSIRTITVSADKYTYIY